MQFWKIVIMIFQLIICYLNVWKLKINRSYQHFPLKNNFVWFLAWLQLIFNPFTTQAKKRNLQGFTFLEDDNKFSLVVWTFIVSSGYLFSCASDRWISDQISLGGKKVILFYSEWKVIINMLYCSILLDYSVTSFKTNHILRFNQYSVSNVT